MKKSAISILMVCLFVVSFMFCLVDKTFAQEEVSIISSEDVVEEESIRGVEGVEGIEKELTIKEKMTALLNAYFPLILLFICLIFIERSRGIPISFIIVDKLGFLVVAFLTIVLYYLFIVGFVKSDSLILSFLWTMVLFLILRLIAQHEINYRIFGYLTPYDMYINGGVEKYWKEKGGEFESGAEE